MKPFIIFSLSALLCLGCERGSFDVSNPDVKEFVRQLKNGTYNQFERTESGERLWAIMPAFKKEDLPGLISLAEDTDLISPCDHFPVNPLSSIWPYRIVDGKECIMVGEYLLWCAEAVIEGKDFASLIPVLRDAEGSPDRRLTAAEILAVRNIYQEWWEEYGHNDNPEKLPLDGSGYTWR